ncbi:hypothetical protein B0H14DRAFT_3435377 [Mycena olivaceomarginata]|nr:hypothetical protein B0H14DRAFT_3435377 [Mycena olivaceomarginata]
MVALALLPALLLICCTISVATFTFHSPDGFALVRQILLGALPTFKPHTYQMDGVCKVLDKIDLVAVTPTGSGKTGFFFLTILVMIAITANPSLCPSTSFPKDPAIVVVPNKLNQTTNENMAKMGICTLMINADTVAAARIRREELWIKARKGISMLILSPEQLISKGFQDLLKFERFYKRVCALEVDEIHLLSIWGLAFRKAFTQIGFMRARFRPSIPIIGLTTTLLADPKVSDSIFNYLGVNRGEFYLLHRSNSRHDIQILFRTLHSGIDGLYFPELTGCLPEQSPKAQRLTKVMKEVGMARLEEFRLAVWFEASDLTAGLTPLAEFLPNIVIQLILDRFARLQAVEDVADVVKNIVGMQGQHLALVIVIV